MTRPRLLFLCQTLPYPPDGGVKIRSYHILRLLCQTFEVEALCFYRVRTRASKVGLQATLGALRTLAPTEAFPVPQGSSRFRFFLDHLRSVTSRRAYTNFVYDAKPFRDKLRQTLARGRFDLVHFDTMDLGRYIPQASGAKVACTHHNVESKLLRDRASWTSPGIRASYLRYQAELLRREEARLCPAVDLNVTVSEDDAAVLRTIAPTARFAVIPNGVDTDFFTPAHRRITHDAVFVGGTTWFPNRDALEYFTSAILPKIRQHRPGFKAKWVGRATAEEQRRYGDESTIELTGYVDDIRPHVQASLCYIAPIRAGGGTRLKILDAWAMGMPVITTSVGAMGLKAEDGRNILVRDDPESFARAVEEVLTDSDLRTRLASGGRATAVGEYGWNVIGERLSRLYLDLLAGRE